MSSMPTLSDLLPIRQAMTHAYRMNETEALTPLIKEATLDEASLIQIKTIATDLVQKTREYKKKQSKLDALLHQYDLSTDEGIALMCMAEALLRIPDKATIDQFISDKLSQGDWYEHLDRHQSLFINAATWSLLLTGKIYGPASSHEKSLSQTLKRTVSKMGASVIRPIILRMMKMIGNQFVMGESIEAAIKRSVTMASLGYRFSFDMLGEGARTVDDATHYFDTYFSAIHAIGRATPHDDPIQNPGISVKLSALFPRYEYAQAKRVLAELPPKLLTLAKLAQSYQMNLTIDAEEADRLDLSLDIFETVYRDLSLTGYSGLGIVIQAYQKRAPYVIDWVMKLSEQVGRRIMVRLVKGAYWDAEIKTSQLAGFEGYPVYTRKHATDTAYVACAKKLLSRPDLIYPQFGTHNAYTVASIMNIAKGSKEFEFQCLHGMGRPLYDHIVTKDAYDFPCRIYAPVGTHRDLLGYLVRRLLENGANSSFVNQLADDDIPIEMIIRDPVQYIIDRKGTPHPKIPLPRALYQDRINSMGLDLSNAFTRESLLNSLKELANTPLQPVQTTERAELEHKFNHAHRAQLDWANLAVEERAHCLERAANLFEARIPEFVNLLTREAHKCIPDALSEIRETIDFCRYYAHRARIDMAPITLTGPTGELNQLSLHPKGTIVCISPWNFPLAIFTGQIVAALVTGNAVIAKPAEQTPRIAQKAVALLHEAGIPQSILQTVIGSGRTIGSALVGQPTIAGVMFTGSTETAKTIERTLAESNQAIALFIAETGGQNAMIVDSSALLEQTVHDIAISAFNSAGQRCSALRVLFVQDTIADKLLQMLAGYLATWTMGDPSDLATDIGPVIDGTAKTALEKHINHLISHGAKLVTQLTVPESLYGHGHYVGPHVFELPDLSLLKREVFGPILHVIRYKSNQLDAVLETIRHTGYGLTFGIHSRIDATVNHVLKQLPVGNAYVNRNMIGAVVGVQPFGGERLSGTGPKAGGPHYLPRLCVERTVSINTTAVGGNAKLVSLLAEDDH